jgi:purine-binding chemotaxis protein CheW
MSKEHSKGAVVAKFISENREYVTFTVGEQLFGLPIDRVHDVFIASSITRVPLSPSEVVGLLNLRGRVVTATCMRRRLGLPSDEQAGYEQKMAVGIEHAGESFGLLVDNVGEVMRLPIASLEPNPVHIDPRWAVLSEGVHRLDGRLLIILSVDSLLSAQTDVRRAA